jgi:hypothetical protein
MNRIDKALAERTAPKPHSQKMLEMAQRSAAGDLTSFAGVFTQAKLTDLQKETIESLLHGHTQGHGDIESDFQQLLSITGEIKAIDNQALLLHGERIAKAQKILIRYREGAFTAWLKIAYGNRQTPYNFLHYYQFHEAIAKDLRMQLALMPRQAVYTLASRDGPLQIKERLVATYAGESKNDLLKTIRHSFPLTDKDKRKRNSSLHILKALQNIHTELKEYRSKLTPTARREIQNLLEEISTTIKKD